MKELYFFDKQLDLILDYSYYLVLKKLFDSLFKRTYDHEL